MNKNKRVKKGQAKKTWSARFERWLQDKQPALAERQVVQIRRQYILPSRSGMGFLLLLLVLFVAAVNYNNNLVFGFLFILAVLLVRDLHLVHGNLLGVGLAPPQATPVHVGETLSWQCRLDNQSPKPRFAVVLDVQVKSGGFMAVADLPAQGGCEVVLAFPAEQRGLYTLPTLRISTTFPLGWFYTWSYFSFASKVWVYPKPDFRLPLHFSAGEARAEELAQTLAKSVGSDEFAGLRPYQAGDSWRQIAWKSVARNESLVTKSYEAERGEEVFFDWQQWPWPVEERLSIFTAWVLEAERLGLRYGLRLPALTIAASQGAWQQQQCLTALAAFPNHPNA
jgi:uncharacterized protein (DUF58 family)